MNAVPPQHRAPERSPLAGVARGRRPPRRPAASTESPAPHEPAQVRPAQAHARHPAGPPDRVHEMRSRLRRRAGTRVPARLALASTALQTITRRARAYGRVAPAPISRTAASGGVYAGAARRGGPGGRSEAARPQLSSTTGRPDQAARPPGSHRTDPSAGSTWHPRPPPPDPRGTGADLRASTRPRERPRCLQKRPRG